MRARNHAKGCLSLPSQLAKACPYVRIVAASAPAADAGRDLWPELYGRAAGLQLSLDKATLPENLEGWTMPELAKAFASSEWGTIDLGAAFEAARAQMRGETFTPPPAAKAYTNKQSIENALEVAEALLMLRGFSGSGKGTLPFILEAGLPVATRDRRPRRPPACCAHGSWHGGGQGCRRTHVRLHGATATPLVCHSGGGLRRPARTVSSLSIGQ